MKKQISLPGPLQSKQFEYDSLKWLYAPKSRFNYRASKKGVNGRIRFSDLVELIKTNGMMCQYCGCPVRVYPRNVTYIPDALTFDHKKSMGIGGTNHISNIVISCLKCNFERNHNDQVYGDQPAPWQVLVKDPYTTIWRNK